MPRWPWQHYIQGDAKGGLWVKTFSGTNTQRPIGIVSPHTTVWHIVKLVNLYDKPCQVLCVGSILPANPRKLKFSSSEGNVTASTWESDAELPPAPGKHDFTHVMLQSLPGSSGDQGVKVEVVGSWPGKRVENVIELYIIVKISL